jgi:hypothetical protein
LLTTFDRELWIPSLVYATTAKYQVPDDRFCTVKLLVEGLPIVTDRLSPAAFVP